MDVLKINDDDDDDDDVIIAEVDSDPNRTFCSRAGCEAVCVVSGRPAGAMTSPRGHPVQCPTVSLVSYI